ncbi:MAG TPA: NADPH-dependent FMN reductase [Blastocatellia bacterium]|nr:NADPH-dependent FMN reductase [Blastocatellia bacterium]
MNQVQEAQPQTENQTTVIGIVGSLRAGSYTRLAVEQALQAARDAGARTRLIDLKDYQLIFCDGESPLDSLPTDVAKLRTEVASAQGIILGTPEYHGSFSGVLKNALDLLDGSEISGKVIGLIGVSGGALGGIDALNSLRVIARSLHSWVIPQQVAIPEAWKVFDETGKIKDHKLEKRVQEVGRQVARFASLHASLMN